MLNSKIIHTLNATVTALLVGYVVLLSIVLKYYRHPKLLVLVLKRYVIKSCCRVIPTNYIKEI
jgi:hypothetical protein